MSEIPTEVGEMPELLELEMRKNTVSEVVPELSACTSLVKLHLGENKISQLPGFVMGSLTKMQELHVYKNKVGYCGRGSCGGGYVVPHSISSIMGGEG